MAKVSRRVSDAFSSLRQVPERVSGALSPFQSGAPEWSSPAWSSPERRTASIRALGVRDAKALAKVVQSEIGHWPAAELDRAVGPHIASILNRVAAPGYPKSVEGVVNQDRQYSAINSLGHWDLLPDASDDMQRRVENALYEMAMGRPYTSSTHFLNPKKVGQKHLDRWGNRVVADAIRDGEVFGFPPNDAHYMGTDPTMRPGLRPSFSFAPGYGPAAPGYVTAERDFQLANRIAPQGFLFGVPETGSADSGRFAAPPEEPVHTGRNSTKGSASRSQRNDIPFLKKLIGMAG